MEAPWRDSISTVRIRRAIREAVREFGEENEGFYRLVDFFASGRSRPRHRQSGRPKRRSIARPASSTADSSSMAVSTRPRASSTDSSSWAVSAHVSTLDSSAPDDAEGHDASPPSIVRFIRRARSGSRFYDRLRPVVRERVRTVPDWAFRTLSCPRGHRPELRRPFVPMGIVEARVRRHVFTGPSTRRRR